MPEDEGLNLQINKEVLNQCLERLKSVIHSLEQKITFIIFREMQYSGEAIPEKITITVDTESQNAMPFKYNELSRLSDTNFILLTIQGFTVYDLNTEKIIFREKR